MSDLIILESGVRDDGVCFMRVMSGERIDADAFTRVEIQEASRASAVVSVKADKGTGMFYLSAEWDVREVVHYRHPVDGAWEQEVFLYRLSKGERVSVVAWEAAKLYHAEFGKFPEYAWMRKLPRMPEGGEWLDGDLLLLQADWVPERCVAVGS